ncbi:Photosystem I assembly protein Ycf3 [Flavobacterium anhuiense]|uniref:Photosystem I assembly protein Ycf3 n=1 Tax=Flavobacterium anhuiense TaxID=459526 RepID=A0AAC9D092_9FLAO|nr:tetratricopeptide repeat protein [Flavobacterium anhuiense]AOC95581.1 Photosystem I assembly protein Ycf3 [Flavobacterium anhuiense]
MKISSFLKILLSTFFLLSIPTSCEKGKKVIVKKIDNTAEVRRLTIIGDNYFDNSDYKNAFPIYKKIIFLSDPVKDRIDLVDALIALSHIYQYQGNYILSEEMVVKILPHLKYMKKTRFAWQTYFIQGFNYFKTGNLERALFYYRKALRLNTSADRKWSILNSMGVVYMKQKRYKLAAYIFEIITTVGYSKTNSSRNRTMGYCVELNNLGICYYNLKNPKALDIYKKVLEIRLKMNDREDISTSYTVLSEYYLNSNPSLAKKYAQIGYKKASEINFYTDRKYCLSFLVQSAKGNELRKYTNLYINFMDSINTAKLKLKNEFSDIKYNFKRDKEENLELRAQKAEHQLEMQRQKNRSYISYVVISISLLSLMFIVFHLTKKRKRDTANEIFKNEMRISEKLQSELEKDIDKILSFSKNSNLEKEENKEQFLTHLNNIYSKTRNISRETSEILTDENFEIGLKEMVASYATSHLNIIINGLNTFSWSKIDRVKKITASRVIQEIFEQMKTLNNASLASITFKKNKKNIFITYTDNGTKFNGEQSILEKRLQNVENRIETIKGTINFDANSESGFKISIKFPI